MRPIHFKEANGVLAKDQPEYLPLPVCTFGDGPKTLASCWRLSFWERIKILFTGKLWLMQMTFGYMFQPQLPTVHKPIPKNLPYDE